VRGEIEGKVRGEKKEASVKDGSKTWLIGVEHEELE
jgi:hypothetical protein